MWGAGVELARAGAVEGVSDDGDEIFLRVKARADPSSTTSTSSPTMPTGAVTAAGMARVFMSSVLRLRSGKGLIWGKAHYRSQLRPTV